MQDTIIKVAGIAAVAGPLLMIGGQIVGTISTIAGGLGGLVGGLGGLGGAASAATPSIEGAGASFINAAAGALKMIGAAAALYIAAQAINVLVDAAIRITSAGGAAIAVLAGMAIGIGALMGVAAALGPALTAGALGIGVFGAAMLGIGAGIDLACDGISRVVDAIGRLVEVVSSNAEGINSIVTNIGTTVGDTFTTITDGITTVIDAISGGLQGVLEGIAGIFDSMGTAALNAGTGFEKLATAVTNLTNNTGVFDLGATLGAVAKGVGDINTAASGAGDAAAKVTTMTTAFQKLGVQAVATTKQVTTFSTGFKTGMIACAKSLSTANLSGAMNTAMSGAIRSASSGIATLKGMFSRTSFSFNHHIAVPHFSMSGKFDAQTGSVPTVKVSGWWAKAAEYDALFDTPTIIGVGDAPQGEVLLGEEKLRELTGADEPRTVNNWNITIDGAKEPGVVVDELLRRVNMKARMA